MAIVMRVEFCNGKNINYMQIPYFFVGVVVLYFYQSPGRLPQNYMILWFQYSLLRNSLKVSALKFHVKTLTVLQIINRVNKNTPTKKAKFNFRAGDAAGKSITVCKHSVFRNQSVNP